VTHHDSHCCEQIPHCGIVEVPIYVTFKMQCGIAIFCQVHHLEHNYIWIWFIQLCTLHTTKEKTWDPSYLWRASSSSLAVT
jgi:hypothetical protein